MKRFLLVLVALASLFGAPAALATCPSTLQLKDNAGVTPNAKYTDDGSGNCIANNDIWQWAGTNLGAPSTYGTSPGAVLVPGVNAFITNTPTVTANVGTGVRTVSGPTANGSAAANPPVVIGGTSNGTGTGNVGNWKVDSSGTGWIDAVVGGQLLTSLSTINTSLGTLNTTAGSPIVSPQNVSPTDCSGTITTGGTAQNAFAAQTALHGFVIKNIDASAGSGEPLWVSLTGTATANTAASYPLAAPASTTFASGESFTSPMGMGINHAVSIVGATTGHKFSCTWW